MATKITLIAAILAIVAASALLQTTTAQTTHVVGDGLGWVVPSLGPIVYANWSVGQTFIAGDILVFNFTTGKGDVARVSAEAFFSCNSTNPISLKTTGPANFTLDTLGAYYFIGTVDRNCILGQRLIVNVSAYPGPTPSPAPRGPVNHTVGDAMGWIVPPGGPIAYATWAFYNTFIVGDTLVFNIYNETSDVAVVTKEVYESCNISSTLAVYNTTPTIYITLTTTGEHFYTSTYPNRCRLGQKLALNVTASPSSTAPTPSANAPSIGVSPSNSATGEPTTAPLPASSAPAKMSGGYAISFLVVAMALFH